MNLFQIQDWAADLAAIRRDLIPSLAATAGDHGRSDSERLLAANLLSRYGDDDPDLLAELCKEADLVTYAPLFAALAQHHDSALLAMRRELDRPLPDRGDDGERAVLRRVNAAISLLQLKD